MVMPHPAWGRGEREWRNLVIVKVCVVLSGYVTCLRVFAYVRFWINVKKKEEEEKKVRLRVFCFPKKSKMRFTFVNCKTTHSAKAKDTVKKLFQSTDTCTLITADH